MKKKSIALVLSLALVVVCIIGGTLAWLTANTDPVTNTFTTSDINITLEESKDLNLKMIPGWTITKDPKVTVTAGSEKCYLFVKLDKSENFDRFMSYEMAEGWKPLKDAGDNAVAGVFYRTVETSEMGRAYSVLKDDQVTVNGTVTKEMMNNLTETTRPTLTVTAYASQFNSSNATTFTAAQAWANVNN